jgi:hypothetical protein
LRVAAPAPPAPSCACCNLILRCVVLAGAAPLAWAGWHGCAGAASALLACGADASAVDDFTGTAAHWAGVNGHAETAEVLRAAAGAGPVVPRAPATPCAAAAFRRTLQVKHAPRLESDARVAAAVAVRLLGMACEEATGHAVPGPVRQRMGALLMEHAFTLWPPATQPRV